jgi:hypothetical protein
MMRDAMTCGQCDPTPGQVRGWYDQIMGTANCCADPACNYGKGALPRSLATTMSNVGTGKKIDDGCPPYEVWDKCANNYTIADLKRDLAPEQGYVAVVSGDMMKNKSHCCSCWYGSYTQFQHTFYVHQYDPATDLFAIYDPDADCNSGHAQSVPNYWTSAELDAVSRGYSGNSYLCVLLGKGVTSSTSSSDFIFDLTGYFTADASGYGFHALGTPTRMLDTRYGTSRNASTGKLSVSAPVTFDGESAYGSGAAAVAGNVTVTNQTAGWSIYLGPAPLASPPTSTLNFVAGDTRSNGVTVGLGSGNTLSATYSGPAGNTTDLIFDETGAFY